MILRRTHKGLPRTETNFHILYQVNECSRMKHKFGIHLFFPNDYEMIAAVKSTRTDLVLGLVRSEARTVGDALWEPDGRLLVRDFGDCWIEVALHDRRQNHATIIELDQFGQSKTSVDYWAAVGESSPDLPALAALGFGLPYE